MITNIKARAPNEIGQFMVHGGCTKIKTKSLRVMIKHSIPYTVDAFCWIELRNFCRRFFFV